MDDRHQNGADSKIIAEHRKQMEEIYQQKLKVSRRIKRKLSPIKMEKSEA